MLETSETRSACTPTCLLGSYTLFGRLFWGTDGKPAFRGGKGELEAIFREPELRLAVVAAKSRVYPTGIQAPNGVGDWQAPALRPGTA